MSTDRFQPQRPAPAAPSPGPTPAMNPAMPSASAPAPGPSTQGPTHLGSLGASLMQDLQRSALGGDGRRHLLEVLAAAVRHGQALSVQMRIGTAPVQLTVFPLARLMHCDRSPGELLGTELGTWQVDKVTPALVAAPPVDPMLGKARPVAPFSPLAPLLWAVALAGSRGELLPELAGQAAYRLAPGVSLAGLYMPPPMIDAIARLRRNTSSLRDIAQGPEIGPERAMRLLNALYLQSALIVSRTHPAATNEDWQGYS